MLQEKAVLGGKLVFKARGPVHAVWEVGTSFPLYRQEAEAQKDHCKASELLVSQLYPQLVLNLSLKTFKMDLKIEPLL